MLRLVANDEPILSVARKMGINDSIIHTWRAAEKKNKGRANGREEKQPFALFMEEQNWQAIQARSFVPRTTDSSHRLQTCPNLLLELGTPVRPDLA